MKPVVAITIGDFNGIGPEITLKAALSPKVTKVCRPILVGPLDIFEQTARRLRKRVAFHKAVFPALPGKGLQVVDVGDGLWMDVTQGTPTKSSGRTAGQAIEKAIELCLAGHCAAMVTGPVSKHALHLAGYTFPGQTEFVALLSGSQRVLMILVSKPLKVGLVTIHTAVKNIATQISKEKVVEKITLLADALRRDFGIDSPSVAVLGLNPHAGEEGAIGTEERDIIVPAIETAKQKGLTVEGPFPADAFFGKQRHKQFDGVLAMYHDQGLVALKLLSFGTAVNMSAGLKIVRTSPDHGTAYDIAGKNKAESSSIIEATLLAVQIAARRKRQ